MIIVFAVDYPFVQLFLLLLLYLGFLLCDIKGRRKVKQNPVKLFSIMEKSFFTLYLFLMLTNAYIVHRDYTNFSLQVKISYVLILAIFVTVVISFGFVLFTMIMDCRRKSNPSLKIMSDRKARVIK